MSPYNDEIEFDLEGLDPIIGDSPTVSSVYLNDQDIEMVSELLFDTSDPELLTAPCDMGDEYNRNNYQELDITRIVEEEIAGTVLPPGSSTPGENGKHHMQSLPENCMNLNIAAIESDLELDSIGQELEGISSTLYKEKASVHSANMGEHSWAKVGYPNKRTQRQSLLPNNQVGMLLPMTHTITPHNEQQFASSARMQQLLSGLPFPALHDFDEHMENMSFREVDNPTPKTATSVQRMNHPTVNDVVVCNTAGAIKSQIDAVRNQSGQNDFSDHTIFSPTTPGVTVQPTGPQPKLRYSEGASASHYCHICGRASNTAQLAACANVKLGLCRKTLCEKCLLLHQSNLFSWAKARNSTWTCTHCRGVCPKRARCHQYQRNNMRRRLQNARRNKVYETDDKQSAESSGVGRRGISKGSNTPKDRTNKKKAACTTGAGSKLQKNVEMSVRRTLKADHRNSNSRASAPNCLLPDWCPKSTAPTSDAFVERLNDVVKEFSNASTPVSAKNHQQQASGEWLPLPQEADHRKNLPTSENVDCRALDELIEKSISQGYAVPGGQPNKNFSAG